MGWKVLQYRKFQGNGKFNWNFDGKFKKEFARKNWLEDPLFYNHLVNSSAKLQIFQNQASSEKSGLTISTLQKVLQSI